MRQGHQVAEAISKGITAGKAGQETLTQEPETSKTLTEIDERVINRLFKRLKEIFPKWREIWQSDGEVAAAKRQWTKSLLKAGVCDVELIQLGIDAARDTGWVRPPGPGQFVKWCIEAAKERAGIPSKENAISQVMAVAKKSDYARKRTRLVPAVYQMCRFIDWYKMRFATVDQAEKWIAKAYDEMIDHWKKGNEFAEQPLLVEHKNPSGVVTKASREKGRKTIAELKGMLNGS